MTHILDKRNWEDVTRGLTELGFSEKEALVYIALLNLGEVGASKIVSATGLHGQFVYDSLKNLEAKGFVQHSIVRGRRKFTAQRPENLTHYVDQKKRIAESLVSELNKNLTISNPQQFEIYQGTDAFVANEFKIVAEASPNSEMLVIGGTGDRYRETHGKFFEEYEYQRIKKNIKVRYIGSEVQREFLRANEDSRNLFSSRLLPGVFAGETNTSIYEHKICFYIFGSPVVSFAVSNEKIAKGYSQFFEMLWKLGK
jgi:sugar-specific transcriptional regulator TrmB